MISLSLKAVKARFLLLALSLFYDVAFVSRIWTDPDLKRASIGVLGIFITGFSAIIYAVDRLLFSATLYPTSDLLILIGLSLFLAGSWRGRISIAFNLKESWEVLGSRGTALCILSDTKQSSSLIEGLVNQSQTLAGENSLKATECYLVFATEIWRESLTKKGLNLLGEMFANVNLGDLFAGKNHVPSM
ncbi:MAG: hypothetical protein FJZ49_04630 [Candidatus Verstraetearchaeota archaeon]|nr:hypothetical protein [Candidatus Verstraetearchaeota archaeon]